MCLLETKLTVSSPQVPGELWKQVGYIYDFDYVNKINLLNINNDIYPRNLRIHRDIARDWKLNYEMSPLEMY